VVTSRDSPFLGNLPGDSLILLPFARKWYFHFVKRILFLGGSLEKGRILHFCRKRPFFGVFGLNSPYLAIFADFNLVFLPEI
jgi:hypothetical protein